MKTARVVLRQLAIAVAATLLFWGVVVPRACGDDTVIPLDGATLCPAGHQYEPLRLAGPRWVGLCYDGKDGKAAVARACTTRACDREGLRTLDESVKESGQAGGCAPEDVGCHLWDIYLYDQLWHGHGYGYGHHYYGGYR